MSLLLGIGLETSSIQAGKGFCENGALSQILCPTVDLDVRPVLAPTIRILDIGDRRRSGGELEEVRYEDA